MDMENEWRAKEVAEKILGKPAQTAAGGGATTPDSAELVCYLDSIRGLAETILDECACARALVTEDGR
jgi:hypothetical protein